METQFGQMNNNYENILCQLSSLNKRHSKLRIAVSIMISFAAVIIGGLLISSGNNTNSIFVRHLDEALRFLKFND